MSEREENLAIAARQRSGGSLGCTCASTPIGSCPLCEERAETARLRERLRVANDDLKRADAMLHELRMGAIVVVTAYGIADEVVMKGSFAPTLADSLRMHVNPGSHVKVTRIEVGKAPPP